MLPILRACRFSAFVATVALAASRPGMALGQDETIPDREATPVGEIRDDAGMFDPGLVRRIDAVLERLSREHQVSLIIETVDSLQDQDINEVASRRRVRAGRDGLYFLIAKREQRISRVMVSGRLADRIPEARRAAIREAFIQEFRKEDLNAGLARGVRAIAAALMGEPRNEKPRDFDPFPDGRPVSSPEVGGTSLVARGQVRLNLAGARKVVEGAEAKAAAMGLKVNIVVVDDGGHPVAFARMDGARPASGYTATTKAITAATFRQATGPLPAGAEKPDPLLSLSLQNAAAVSGGKVTTLLGGLPIVVDGQVIGGIGIGGGTGEQDVEVARAGVAALMDGLREGRPPEE